MNTLTILRNGSQVAIVNIDTKTIFSRKIMGDHRIVAKFVYESVLPVMIGDYVTHGTENYYINRIPSITKVNNNTYEHEIQFESVGYDLAKKIFMSIDGLAEYGQTGTANNFVQRIVTNMNVNQSGWSIGSVDPTDEKTIIFSNETCAAALTKIAETFKLEYFISGKSIIMTKSTGNVTAYSFTYGKNQGLYKLERQQVSDQNIVTKVYGFGSMQNIPYTYRNRAKRLVFEERFLTKNTNLYGVIEGQYTNDDIFPNRTATVTDFHIQINSGVYDPYASYIEDVSLVSENINLNDYKVEGLEWSVVFKSGYLSGKEFIISKYDHSTGRIYLNPNSEEDGYTTPNESYIGQPAINDEYTLINISLPQSYIDTAEDALEAATQAYLDENSIPMVVYTIDIDPKFARLNAIHLKAGDRVTVVDSALGINNLIRISAIEYPLTDPYSIKAVIADQVPYTLQERVIQSTIGTKTEVRVVDRTSDELTRRWAMRMSQLKDLVFDTDGYFDPTRIKPLSIETMHLAVGAMSGSFHLNGVRIIPNFQGNYKSFYISEGSLVHHSLQIEGLGYEWMILSSLFANGLDDATAYYLYAKCSTGSLSGEWVLSNAQIQYDDEPGYYMLLCGILYAVYTDDEGKKWRDFDFTYGMTYINGRNVTTGRIQTINKLNYIDLDYNEFRIGDSQNSIQWNVDGDGNLVIIGGLIQREPGGDYFNLTVYRGDYSISELYKKGDEVTYNDQTWICIQNLPFSGMPPSAGPWWKQLSEKGVNGQDGASPVGVFRGEYSNGTDYYGTQSRVDIVYYTPTLRYYIARPRETTTPFRGIVPTNTLYWNDFGAQFESVATKVLFAEDAIIYNASIQNFIGVPAGVGDMSGVVHYTQASMEGTPRIDSITLYGSTGTANVYCNGLIRMIAFYNTLLDTADNFVDTYTWDFYAVGILLTHVDNVLYFQETNGNDFSGTTGIGTLSGSLGGSATTVQSHQEGTPRIDTVTLSGTGGMASIICDSIRHYFFFEDSLAQTIDNFIARYYSQWFASDVIMTRSGNSIVFTSRYKGQNFTGATAIQNVPNTYQGAISMTYNQIWDDQTNSDDTSILINMKGYKGGTTYGRKLLIGDGRGNSLLQVGYNPTTGKKYVKMNVENFNITDLPRSKTGLFSGDVYIDANGFLKVAPQ